MDSSLPAIVLPIYNRPDCLKRLLRSLLSADFSGVDGEIPLVFSLEGGTSPDCRALALETPWPYGPKRVVEQPTRLGVRHHILACGDLTETYGSVIVLEDDLTVSPGFYAFAKQAAEFYTPDPRIGGVSLYAFIFNEYGFFPFVPMDDGNDVYFVQSTSSWGQLWTREQWAKFRGWLRDSEGPKNLASDVRLPQRMREWPESSWKKLYNASTKWPFATS